MRTIANEPRTFAEVRARLDEIVTEVRNPELSLEKSLDLYEEAVKLGGMCADMVDRANYTPEEELEASDEGISGESQIAEDDKPAEEAGGAVAEAESTVAFDAVEASAEIDAALEAVEDSDSTEA